MPVAAPRPCRHKGCRALVTNRDGFCDAHRKAVHKRYNDRRQSTGQRVKLYDSAAWKRARAAHLQSEPMCRECRAHGQLVAAQVVDHIMPIKDGGAELDDSNLQSLCKSCHNRKTIKHAAGGG
ncbi:MAG: HNH endonuclease [Methylomicrobium sp.]|nr:HNH endonuclease [Methylomicrobium sp.]